MNKYRFNVNQSGLAILNTARMLFPLLFSSIVGIGSGLLSVALIKSIHFSETFFFTDLKNAMGFLGPFAVIFIPCIGGLLVGILVIVLAPETKGHGVPEVMKAIAVRGGKIRPIVILVKTLASSLSIGSGASVGREGPAVQIGSAFGSSVAQLFRLNATQTKNLVACGAAGGIAAVFNAPLAGVMFSLEVIMRDFGARSLSTVVVSALSASIISRALLGNHPAFMAPIYGLHNPWEILLYLLLGVISAFISLLFIFTLDKSESLSAKINIPSWLKPALGGLAIGCIGFFAPNVLGSGLHSIEQALTGSLTWQVLTLLIFLKIFATSISLGTGSSGGTFAPTLFVGAALGGALGNVFFHFMPFSTAPPGAYALAGMASVFASATQAPVTAILLIFELTNDYKLILPIMAGVVASSAITQLFTQESIDTINLKRMGIDIRLLQETKFLSALRVHDAMSKNFAYVQASLKAKELVQRMSKEKEKIYFVRNAKMECIGWISLDIMRELLFEKDVSVVMAHDLMTPIQETIHPNDSLSEAANIMTQHNLKFLPVMDTAKEDQLVGVIRPEDFHHAFTHITLKQAELLNRLEHESEQAGGVKQMAFRVLKKSDVCNQAIRQILIPKGVVVTSIERKKDAIIPAGDTILMPNDKVWVGVIKSSEKGFQDWIREHHLSLF